MRPPQFGNRAACRGEVGEQGLSVGGYGCDQIELSVKRTASLAKIVIGHDRSVARDGPRERIVGRT